MSVLVRQPRPGRRARRTTLRCGGDDPHAPRRAAEPSKLTATKAYGAHVVGFDRYGEDREALALALAQWRGLHLVHPFDDPHVMAGAGTVALELLEDAAELDLLLVPVGGGGLISGCATVVKALSPATRAVGVEPLASDDVARSKASGRRQRVVVGVEPLPPTTSPARKAPVVASGSSWAGRSPTDSSSRRPGRAPGR